MSAAGPAAQPVIELSGVDVALGGRPVLRGIDLAVRAGEVVALLGANGSGKSTLVRTAVGLHAPSRGHVRLFGHEVADRLDRSRLGYVPQRAGAATGVPATVAEVVASGRLSRRRPFVPASRADRAAVTEALETVGLADRAKHTVATLSGGQQQRVLIARALAGQPDLVVLDEPNAGVDQENQAHIAGTLSALARRGGTLVLVLHELGPFRPLIQRVVELREGRIAYDGGREGLVEAEHPHHHHSSHPGRRGDGDALVVPLSPTVNAPLEGGYR